MKRAGRLLSLPLIAPPAFVAGAQQAPAPAEPYYAVTTPSDMVVIENAIRQEAS